MVILLTTTNICIAAWMSANLMLNGERRESYELQEELSAKSYEPWEGKAEGNETMSQYANERMRKVISKNEKWKMKNEKEYSTP